MMVEVKLSGLDGVLDTLKKLPPEIVSKRGGPVKAALRKGARVIQQEAALNLARAINAFDDEGASQSTGLLSKSLVVTRGKQPTGGKGERYLVRVLRKTYRRKGSEVVTTRKTAHLLEYGSSRQTAEPWLRPAFHSKAAQAISVIESDLLRSIARVVKKLSKPRMR